MGNLFVRVMDSLSGTTQKKILLLGLDAAGSPRGTLFRVFAVNI